jgi:hypothetical protein
MNWDAISALAEIGGTIAVLVTLVYLAIQVKHSNEQRKLEAYRHTLDSLNQQLDTLTQSVETISILNRGRTALNKLSVDERVIFELIHIRVLNSIESWYEQQIQATKSGEIRDKQIANLAGVVSWYFAYPGAREIWLSVKHMYSSIEDYVSKSVMEGEAVSSPKPSA